MTADTSSALEELLLAREVEKFLIHEVGLLDDRCFEDWADLFTEDGYYWAPATMDQPDPHTGVSLFFDDVPMMRTRFGRLRHPRVHSQIPPSRTSHMISNVTVETADGSEGCRVGARFDMLEYRPGHDQRTFGGRYEYELRGESHDTFRIAFKKAVIINCDDVHLPIAIPF
ncbi:MAG: aromatic-ring-hydroxylating dioxygenase subunit beta [Alphaproteobacteria bacterium]